MKKSVYSIVLADEVVDAIDSMAYSMNTSRSNLINQILAERVSLVTPEMRMRGIFSAIEQLMKPRFQFLDHPSDAMLSIKSPIRYKYKPTIRYSVELSKNFSGKVGQLRVQFRTQSVKLIHDIDEFFILWRKIEEKYLSEIFTDGVPGESSDGKYIREFYSPNAEMLSEEQTGNAIGKYIQLMDKCIQIYFDGLSCNLDKSAEIEKIYCDYLKKGIIIL